MKYPILTTAIAAIALASTPAIAKNKNKHKHKDHRPDAVVVVDRDFRGDRVIVVDDDRRGNNPKAQGRHDNGLHLGWYKQQWRRGDRIPVGYLEPRYYIDDYNRYGLRAPPDGYRWVRPMDDRYLLVQVATGLILDALGY
ncbi:MAG TPA: RcnB family protein [Xanthomonadaceae bacterium]|nr:RcnB family protein [Xanthomonadaceae bacterium]